MSTAVLRGNVREMPLSDESVDLIVTSPPYWGLRSYTDGGEALAGQIGTEETPQQYLEALWDCTAEWARVLAPGGSIFVNLGDRYSSRSGTGWGKQSVWIGRGRPEVIRQNSPHRRPDSARITGIPEKSLLGLPWRYALGCTDQLGLILRRDIVWSKPNGLPESVTDRCASRHEYLFHLVKRPDYYSAVDEIREPHAEASIRRAMPHRAPPGRRPSSIYNGQPEQSLHLDRMNNPLGKLPGSVWEIPSQPLDVPDWLGADHFAAFPMELPRRCILGWSPPGICVECGEGRRPVTEVAGIEGRRGRKERVVDLTLDSAHGPDGRGGERWRQSIRVTGYACACPDPAAPARRAVVADPFGGTGTTALVADVLGRHGVSFDLSRDYCRIARWRTTDPGERARAMQVPKPPVIPDSQGSLFDVDEAS